MAKTSATFSRKKRLVFRAVCVLVPLLIGVAFYLCFPNLFDPDSYGVDMNRGAWEASYLERGVSVPEAGPREGYWGARQEKRVPDPQLGWRESTQFVPELLSIDDYGRQFFNPKSRGKHRILILGGSVGFGSYASKIEHTYFNIMGRELEERGQPAQIAVMASGAWKSSQELLALGIHAPKLKPNMIIFVNGLNDLTSGGYYNTLFFQEVKTHDGSAWHKFYHSHDYEKRVEFYLDNMRQAAAMCKQNDIKMLVVLQPSLAERSKLTEREKELLAASLQPHKSREAFNESYAGMRKGLKELAKEPHVWTLDCSNVFDQESETTFADLWHFSDFGHKILGSEMAGIVAPILEEN